MPTTQVHKTGAVMITCLLAAPGAMAEAEGTSSPPAASIPGKSSMPYQSHAPPSEDARTTNQERDQPAAKRGGRRHPDFLLPPGIIKNLLRGKPLPPGWQKKIVTPP